MAWGKAGSTTLATSGDDLDITSMTASKFNQYMAHVIATGAKRPIMTFNDQNSGHAYRYSGDGATDGTAISQSNMNLNMGHNDAEFILIISVGGMINS